MNLRFPARTLMVSFVAVATLAAPAAGQTRQSPSGHVDAPAEDCPQLEQSLSSTEVRPDEPATYTVVVRGGDASIAPQGATFTDARRVPSTTEQDRVDYLFTARTKTTTEVYSRFGLTCRSGLHIDGETSRLTLKVTPAPGATPPPSPAPGSCTVPSSVRLEAEPERVVAGEPVTLTATVTSPCEADQPHSVRIARRPAGVYGEAGEGAPEPEPVMTLVTQPGQTATATVTVTPERSTDYLYGLTDATYSRTPVTTVYATKPGAPEYTCPTVVSPTALQARPNEPVRVFLGNDGEGGPQRLAAALIVRTTPAPYTVVRRTTGIQNPQDFRVPENTALVVSGDPDLVGRACPRINVRIQVTPSVTINATRRGVRDYTFAGRVTPGRGQIVTLYRVTETGARVITAQTRVQTDGTYRIDRRFTRSGRFTFRATVVASRTNTVGSSPDRPSVIH